MITIIVNEFYIYLWVYWWNRSPNQLILFLFSRSMAVDNIIINSGTNGESVHENYEKSIGRFRTVLPQVCLSILFSFVWWWPINDFGFQIIASAIVTILLLDIGFSVSFPAVLISALSGLNAENNANETLSLTASQTSWLGERPNRWFFRIQWK